MWYISFQSTYEHQNKIFMCSLGNAISFDKLTNTEKIKKIHAFFDDFFFIQFLLRPHSDWKFHGIIQ